MGKKKCLFCCARIFKSVSVTTLQKLIQTLGGRQVTEQKHTGTSTKQERNTKKRRTQSANVGETRLEDRTREQRRWDENRQTNKEREG